MTTQTLKSLKPIKLVSAMCSAFYLGKHLQEILKGQIQTEHL
jgi:hypothetical protein